LLAQAGKPHADRSSPTIELLQIVLFLTAPALSKRALMIGSKVPRLAGGLEVRRISGVRLALDSTNQPQASEEEVPPVHWRFGSETPAPAPILRRWPPSKQPSKRAKALPPISCVEPDLASILAESAIDSKTRITASQ
jgi:hypothetical protein